MRDNQRYNLLHHVVRHCRPAFLSALFYLGIWKELTRQPDQYGRTPKQLAKEKLFSNHRPIFMEEYDYWELVHGSMTPLMRACLRGDLDDVTRLVRLDPSSVAVKDVRGANSVMYAVAAGNRAIIGFLLSHGSEPDPVTDRRETLLTIAACLGRKDVLNYLLERRLVSDPNLTDHNGLRAVDHIAMNGDVPTMLDMTRYPRMTPDGAALALAASHRRQEMVELLLEAFRLPVAAADNNGRTAMLYAAANGDVTMMRYLLWQGSSWEDRDQQGRNILHLATVYDRVDIVKLAVEELRHRDGDTLTRLLHCQDGYNAKGDVVLIQSRDRGRKAWHYVDVDRRLKGAFQTQLKSGSIDATAFGTVLLSGYGAYPTAEEREELERKVASLSRQEQGQQGQRQQQGQQQQKQQQQQQQQQQGHQQGQHEEQLHQHKHQADMTPLHIAIFRGYTKVARVLLEAGSDPNQQDIRGLSSIHLAAVRGDMGMVRLLAHVDLDLRDSRGNTATELASKNGHHDVADYLLSKVRHWRF